MPLIMKNQIENNSLLAEFLGSELEETVKSEKVYCLLMPDENDISGFKKEFFAPDELKFHKSWDWLMLVVDKIETYLADGCNVDISYNTCTICVVVGNDFKGYTENDGFDIVITSNSKTEATYSACIEFVKWFNSQNK